MAVGKEKLRGALGKQASALEQSKKQSPSPQIPSTQDHNMDMNEEQSLEQWGKTLYKEKKTVEQSIQNIRDLLEKGQGMLENKPDQFKQWYEKYGFSEQEIIELFTYKEKDLELTKWIEKRAKEEKEKNSIDIPIYLL